MIDIRAVVAFLGAALCVASVALPEFPPEEDAEEDVEEDAALD